MRITALETLRLAERPNLIWVHVETDEGITGLGETFFGAGAVEAHLHETVAPRLIGRDPLQIDLIAADLVGYLGYRSTGAEMRGNSAVDLALWDIFGHATGQPVAQLLGGFTRPAIRTYNTCAGPDYIKSAAGQQTGNFGLGESDLDDLTGFLTRADDLALSLLDEGITAMKIWPFDAAAETSRGQYIASDALKSALEPFEKIRRAVGDRMDVMVEFHALWQLLPAMQIAKALAPYGTFWTASRALPVTPPPPPPPSARRRRWRAARASATCWKPARRASSCSMSPGAGA
jgi:L-alanine-DL-glutamate epimerase-like enolase superfamily enzyme